MPPPFVLGADQAAPVKSSFPDTLELRGADRARPGLAPARLACDRSSAIMGIEPCNNRLPRAASYAIIPYI